MTATGLRSGRAAHPGAATYRGAVILPDGTPVRVRPGDPTDPGSSGQPLRATRRTRRVRHLPGRTPVLTGYTGGPIPVDTHGTVRVAVNVRAIVYVLLPWLGCAVAAAWGQLTGHVAVCWAAVAVAFLVGVAAPFVAAPRGLRVPGPAVSPATRGTRAGVAR